MMRMSLPSRSCTDESRFAVALSNCGSLFARANSEGNVRVSTSLEASSFKYKRFREPCANVMERPNVPVDA